MEIHAVTDREELLALHRQAALKAQVRCTPEDALQPTLTRLDYYFENAPFEIAAVYDDGVALEYDVFLDTGRIIWHVMLTGLDEVMPSHGLLAEWVHARCGDCYGVVGDDDLRGLIAQHPRIHDDQGVLRWVHDAVD